MFVSSKPEGILDRAGGRELVIDLIVFHEFVDVLTELTEIAEEKERKAGYRRKIEEFPSLLEDEDVGIEPLALDHQDLKRSVHLMHEKEVDIGDALIYVHMSKLGIRHIVTDDRDWDRLEGIIRI